MNNMAQLESRPEKKADMEMPEEMKKWLDADAQLREGFARLTPACRREYTEFIATARQDKTRVARMVKIAPMILRGAGLNDLYKTRNNNRG